jgi:hypothetical protein
MLRAVNEGFVKLKIELMLMPLTYNRWFDFKKIKIKLRHIYNLLLKSFKRLLNWLFQMKLYRSQIQSGCKFHPGFCYHLGQLLLAPPLGEKGFWLLILGFVLVVKLYAWMKKGFIV